MKVQVKVTQTMVSNRSDTNPQTVRFVTFQLIVNGEPQGQGMQVVAPGDEPMPEVGKIVELEF